MSQLLGREFRPTNEVQIPLLETQSDYTVRMAGCKHPAIFCLYQGIGKDVPLPANVPRHGKLF